ncbi:hypothetical protein LCGC14_2671260 [marine sediment metagenome]|uniref:Uncharacterized protein n=1 Tax=marine sediment metagenome TaxID=412755 RepID=A0A0F9CFY9_9ZZZZ
MLVVTEDGKELLLSELGPEVLCNICEVNIKVEEFLKHNIDKHGWEAIIGTAK